MLQTIRFRAARKNKVSWMARILACAVLVFAMHTGGFGLAQDVAAPQTVLRFATLAPNGSSAARVFDAWNREVRRRSGGSLSLRLYAGGVQGDEAEVIRKIRTGRLDGTSVTSTGLAQIHRPAVVFQIPGVLRTYEQLDAARAALAAETNRGIEGAGFKLLGWGDLGQTRVFSTHQIRTPSDLATCHVWQRRDDLIMPAAMQAFHTNAVPLLVPEVLSALATGRVDTVFAPPLAVVALQWTPRLRYMTDLPMSIVIGAMVLSKPRFDALPADQQTIITETSAQFNALARRNLRIADDQALASILSHGVQSVPVTDAQRREWIALAPGIRQRLVGQVADQATIDRVAAFAN